VRVSEAECSQIVPAQWSASIEKVATPRKSRPVEVLHEQQVGQHTGVAPVAVPERMHLYDSMMESNGQLLGIERVVLDPGAGRLSS
jgi:hypothetical protein